jgi:hypothetical protein
MGDSSLERLGQCMNDNDRRLLGKGMHAGIVPTTFSDARSHFNAATTASKNTIGSIGSLSTGLGWAPKVTITTLWAGLT